MNKIIKPRRDIHRLESDLGVNLLPKFVPEWEQDRLIQWAFDSALNCIEQGVTIIGEKAAWWLDNNIGKVSPINVPKYIHV